MLAADREALICDFAETYGIYDLQALPVSLSATLAAGLRESSRIKMKMSGTKVPKCELLLAAIVDRLSVLLWFQTKNAQNGYNRPRSIVEVLIGDSNINDKIQTFQTAKEYEEEWRNRTGVSHVY